MPVIGTCQSINNALVRQAQVTSLMLINHKRHDPRIANLPYTGHHHSVYTDKHVVLGPEILGHVWMELQRSSVCFAALVDVVHDTAVA